MDRPSGARRVRSPPGYDTARAEFATSPIAIVWDSGGRATFGAVPPADEPPILSSMPKCKSPGCGGVVLAESLTEGDCAFCGLHHRRRAGTARWNEVVGPVVVTLSDRRIGTGNGSAHHDRLEAGGLRFRGERVTIEITRGDVRRLSIIPASKIVRIVARD